MENIVGKTNKHFFSIACCGGEDGKGGYQGGDKIASNPQANH